MRKEFLFPVLFNGSKERKEVHVGRPLPVAFEAGPQHDRPYAMLTEIEARSLIRKSNGMFSFPADIDDRMDSLYFPNISAYAIDPDEAREDLESKEPTKKPRSRKKA